jgi:hypothetical protein
MKLHLCDEQQSFYLDGGFSHIRHIQDGLVNLAGAFAPAGRWLDMQGIISALCASSCGGNGLFL